MPKKKLSPAPTRLGRACPFTWCSANHFDDWAVGPDGDPGRVHWAGLDEVMVDRLWEHADVVFNVYETRTTSGVTFGPLVVALDDRTEIAALDFLRALRMLEPMVDDWVGTTQLEIDRLRSPEPGAEPWQRG